MILQMERAVYTRFSKVYKAKHRPGAGVAGVRHGGMLSGPCCTGPGSCITPPRKHGTQLHTTAQFLLSGILRMGRMALTQASKEQIMPRSSNALPATWTI